MITKTPRVKLKIDVRENTKEAKILKFLKKTGYIILNSFFTKRRKAYTWLGRELLGLDLTDYERYQNKLKRMIISTLERLKEKGLVTQIKEPRKRCWVLNSKGKIVIEKLINNKNNLPQEDGKLRIFIFDISEKKRHERDEIRMNLISFGYKMLQKSVWIGKRPLPTSFLKEIKDKGLWQGIQFFEVKELGTLEDLEI